MKTSSPRFKSIAVTAGLSFWFSVITSSIGLFSIELLAIFVAILLITTQVFANKISTGLDIFAKFNTKIFGVSKDSVEKHKKFINKHSLTIDLISDDGTICEKFGVWVEKSMYGKKYMGIERATFLFDEDLKLIKIWRNVRVKGHVEEVLSFIKDLV